jgi:hypothetical protein
MAQLRNTFDSESLGALESVLDEVHRELASEATAGEAARPVISREQLAKLILHYAQDGESDLEKLRALVLKGVGRG